MLEVEFKYFEQPPSKSKYRVSVAALHLYGLYRNSIHDSFREKPDVSEDIKTREKVYLEADDSLPSKNPLYQSSLYHYSVRVSTDTMKEWQKSAGKMKCFMAFHNRLIIGFVHFTEQTMNGKNVVYIAQAGVQNRGQGVGRRLMECVLAHYPAGTEFYILTRVFNSDAKNLYEKRLKFTPIEINEIEQLGYDKRYCGFKHTTTEQEIIDIKSKQLPAKESMPSHTSSRELI